MPYFILLHPILPLYLIVGAPGNCRAPGSMAAPWQADVRRLEEAGEPAKDYIWEYIYVYRHRDHGIENGNV